jgi:hypothetical protein
VCTYVCVYVCVCVCVCVLMCCVFVEQKGVECSAQVIRVTDVDRLEPQTHSHTQSPRSSASASSAYRPLRKSELSLPQVVISGEIHGNERVVRE